MQFVEILSVLRNKSSHLPIIKDTAAERARYKRKLEEKNKNVALSCKKFEFKTYDGSTSHYFITGARYNRCVARRQDCNILQNLCFFKFTLKLWYSRLENSEHIRNIHKTR